jgi:hypothetical protein
MSLDADSRMTARACPGGWLVLQQPRPGERMRFPEHVKPVWVAASLDTLRGPTTGSVTLPVALDWTPANTYDLSSPCRVQSMYMTVLREAYSAASVDTFLNRDLVMKLWGDLRLRLPWFVRDPWEWIHPELAELAELAEAAEQ